MFTKILGDIGTGLGSFLPSLVKSLVDGFISLFFVTSETGGVESLNALGEVSLVFIVIGMGIKFVPMIAGWLRLKSKSLRKRKAAK